MRHKVFLVILVFCLTLCLLCLPGCEKTNATAVQSASPAHTETSNVGDETAAPISASSEEPAMESTDKPTDNTAVETLNTTEQECLSTAEGIHQLDTNIAYSADLDGDGLADTLLLRNNEEQWSCDVLFNGEKINEGDDWTSIGQAHLICRDDDSIALIYQQNGDDGCCTSSIYTFADGKANKAVYRGNAYSFLTPDALQLTAPVFYFLGNQRVSIEAAINDDFTLTLGNDGWFTIIPAFDSSIPESTYHAKVDIPMLRMENGEYVNATLPAGTRVYTQLINEAQTQMIMKTDDGTLWMYTRDSAGLHFEEGDLFDGCTFAGP